MIHVPRLKHANAAELLLGFRIGTVGRRHFAVPPIQGQRVFRRLRAGSSPRTRRTGHTTVLVMPARSKAWATHHASAIFLQSGLHLSVHKPDMSVWTSSELNSNDRVQ